MFNLIVLQLALSEQERSFWPEEGEEIGDGRAEESSAIWNGGTAAISLTIDIDRIDSGTLLEPDAGSHFWKFATGRGLTIQKIVFHFYTLKMKDQEEKLKKRSYLSTHKNNKIPRNKPT